MMAKVTSPTRRLKPRFRIAAPSRQEAEADRLRERDVNVGWRKWYKTARWQKLRWSVLVRDLFTCQMQGCGRIEADTSQLVADHKHPHQIGRAHV